jgi:hypothetical protein
MCSMPQISPAETKRVLACQAENKRSEWKMVDVEAPWPFSDAQNTAVFTTRFGMKEGHTILHVSHDMADGAWQFHASLSLGPKDAMLVALSEIVRLDPTVCELAALPLGWSAERSGKDQPWEMHPPKSSHQ